jgi:hypothetical protein
VPPERDPTELRVAGVPTQKPLGHASAQLTLDRYSRLMPSMGGYTADAIAASKRTIRLLQTLAHARRVRGNHFILFALCVLLETLADFRLVLPFHELLAALVFGDDLSLELLHRAASVTEEPAEIVDHAGELFGTEDDQEDEPYDHHFLHADTEHGG